MASGRVGGTRSKISGKVGNEIYQVVRNPDGSYSQQVYEKPEIVQTAQTPKLQAQRMITAMVESLMRDLKEVGRISMQSGVNRSKSLNAFSSWNLMLVARDAQANWDGGNQFVYPRPDALYELGGRYMISSGTLSGNLFKYLEYMPAPWVPEGGGGVGFQWATRLVFDVPRSTKTIGALLNYWGMTRLDSVVMAWYRYYGDTDPETETYLEGGIYEYAIFTINPSLPDDTPVTQESMASLFLIQSPVSCFTIFEPWNEKFYLGYGGRWGVDDNYLFYHAAFSISYRDGKKKISPSTLAECYDGLQWMLDRNRPCDNFGAWMNQGEIRPYPNPYL